MRAVVLFLLLGVATAQAEGGDVEVLARAEAVATGHHRDFGALITVRQELEQLVAEEPTRLDTLLALSRLWLITGDRAGAVEDKRAAYRRARDLGRRAVAVNPESAAAHFWYTVSTARWGHTQGVMRSLGLLPEIKRGIARVLELDPKFTRIYALAGYVAYELPPFLGGSATKAEEMFRKGLELDPRFTAGRVGLAKALIRQHRLDEAGAELARVLNESVPTNEAVWTLDDAPEARRLLSTLATSSATE